MLEIHACNIKLGEVPHIVGALTDAEVLNIRNDALSIVDFIELRVDMFQKFDKEHVEAVFRFAKENFRKPIIATVRDIREGGQADVPDRLELYRIIAPFSDLLDTEINSGDTFREVKKICVANKKHLIGSYHNFEATPDDAFLESIVSKGKELGADIIKIAATAVGNDDLARLAAFNYRHREDKLITMSMGEKGMPSRVFAPVFGSLMTYGYIAHPTAPGQLSVSELMYIFRRLKIR